MIRIKYDSGIRVCFLAITLMFFSSCIEERTPDHNTRKLNRQKFTLIDTSIAEFIEEGMEEIKWPIYYSPMDSVIVGNYVTMRREYFYDVDTVNSIPFRNTVKKSSIFEILELRDSYFPKEMVVINQHDTCIGRVFLPNGSEDVKNMSVDTVMASVEGFIIKTNWGGWRWHYWVDFDFKIDSQNIILRKVTTKTYIADQDSTVLEEAFPEMKVTGNGLDLLQYF